MLGIKKSIQLLSLSALLATSAANAEILGLTNGRSANIENAPDTSADAGIVIGEIFEVDYRYIGGRFNYKLAPNMLVFGDIGQTAIDDGDDDLDGITFGAGLLYQIDGLLDNSDTAVKFSYHTGDVENDRFEADISNITLQFLVSGNQLGQSSLGWYGNIGVHLIESGSNDETELGFGGGIFSPASFGEFFLGINLIDDIQFGGGARFKF